MSKLIIFAKFILVAIIGGSLLGLSIAALAPGVSTLSSAHTGQDKVVDAFAELSSRTVVLDSEGNELAVLGIQDRDPVKLKEVPTIIQDMVIISEDATFWDNPGVDARALVRAATSNVSAGGVTQGGSTITQQLVKNRILTDEKTFSRKLKEAVISYRITQQYSKTEILQEYLNTVYFGQGSYGIKAAVERFFKHSLSEITVGEAALLTSLIPNPETWNPFIFPEKARERRAEVLELAQKEGLITKEEQEQGNAETLPTEKPTAELKPQNYLAAEVQRLLLEDERLGKTQQERYNKVLKGGLKVYTSYDPDLQEAAQRAVDEKLPNQPPFTAAMVVMERNTGKVVAMVGGSGFEEAKFNLATQGKRQPGSTYKIVTLVSALNNGFSPNDTVSGTSPCTVKADGYPEWKTANAEGGVGTKTLRTATSGSVNCAFARLIAADGVQGSAQMAERLGINHEVPEYPSIVLGTDEATPLEMTTVYNTVSTGGIRHNPVFITKVEGAGGEVIFEEKYGGAKVLNENIALTTIDILKGVVTSGTGTGARVPGHEVAGKTGTSEEYGDAWFCGMTMKYTSCVWMGDPEARTPMRNVGGRTVFGGTYPASIWKSFMVSAMASEPKLNFPQPDKSKWSRGKYITDKGRGKGSPPPNESLMDPSLTTTTLGTLPPSTTTTVGTIPTSTSTTTDTLPDP